DGWLVGHDRHLLSLAIVKADALAVSGAAADTGAGATAGAMTDESGVAHADQTLARAATEATGADETEASAAESFAGLGAHDGSPDIGIIDARRIGSAPG